VIINLHVASPNESLQESDAGAGVFEGVGATGGPGAGSSGAGGSGAGFSGAGGSGAGSSGAGGSGAGSSGAGGPGAGSSGAGGSGAGSSGVSSGSFWGGGVLDCSGALGLSEGRSSCGGLTGSPGLGTPPGRGRCCPPFAYSANGHAGGFTDWPPATGAFDDGNSTHFPPF